MTMFFYLMVLIIDYHAFVSAKTQILNACNDKHNRLPRAINCARNDGVSVDFRVLDFCSFWQSRGKISQ
ncbi:hypothetical protein [Helicobacter sp. T3_23-1059]